MKKRKKYQAKPTAQFDKSKAQIYGEELERIENEHQELTPDIVVKEAESTDSPLHGCFEWNDTKAGHSWRKQQARHLINHIEYELIIKEEPPRVVRAFVSIKENDLGDRSYIHTETVLQSERLRRKMLEQAVGDLVSIKKKYHELDELVGVFKEVDKIQKKFSFPESRPQQEVRI